MGNVCSSGLKKKKESLSEKSDDTPCYQGGQRKDGSQDKDDKLAPLADPENVPDSNNTNACNANANSTLGAGTSLPIATGNNVGQNSNSSNTAKASDKSSQSANKGGAQNENANSKNMPDCLSLLQGKPPPSLKIERDKKIVLYILADSSVEYRKHKRVIYNLYKHFKSRCQSKGFDFIISDVHEVDTTYKKDYTKLLEIRRWTQSPLEAQGGHEEAANCLNEITRHLSSAYIIPILFLGPTLGIPMLPLTIESQDFGSVLQAASEDERELLEKWYTIDNSYQPMCHRLCTQKADPYDTTINGELNSLFHVLLRLFSDDLKDSYMTTVVEQEINNTVLMSQELAKRCIWIQSGPQYTRAPDNATPLDIEVLRRITRIYAELKNHLSEKNLIRLLPNMSILEEELSDFIANLIEKSMNTIFDEDINKYSLPYNTNGVDTMLLDELLIIGNYSKILAQNSANFDIMNEFKRYIKDNTQHPLVVSGVTGCGKSVLISKIMESIHRWKPEANLILRYCNLTARSSDLTSLLGTIAMQMSILEYEKWPKMSHSLTVYTKLIKKIIKNTKKSYIIIIDGIDDLLVRDHNLSWLPIDLNSNCKIIVTISEGADIDNPSSTLHDELCELGIPTKCFIRMKQFTERQWYDILSSGGGDFYSANAALKLPEEWKQLHGKTPFHAKSLWWLAWLGHVNVPIAHIGELQFKLLQVLETKFTSDYAEVLLLIVALSCWGIRESDCIGVFQNHYQLEAQVAYKIWSKFCWLMGPLLLCLKSVRIADNTFRTAIIKKYAQKQWLVHKTIRDYFDIQEDEFNSAQSNIKIYNVQKFLKLPFHHFHAIIEDNPSPTKVDTLFNCFYFTDMQWMANKVFSSGPSYLFADILACEKLAHSCQLEFLHINFLKDFLSKYMHELNYDGTQFYTFIKYYLRQRVGENPSLKQDEKIISWYEFANEIGVPFLDIVNTHAPEAPLRDNPILNDLGIEAIEESQGRTPDDYVGNYDVIMNLPVKGSFVATISTGREEICVWDVRQCSRIRELQGVPQPTTMCPVGNYDAAVLCRREIKVFNLDEGEYKVTLKGVMNQKMPYFGLHDQNHLVCLSRNRMYVNLMNLESGDCVTTFKAGEDRFLNSLLVSGDGRILVCGDETQKPFPLLVWHLSQRKLLYDLRIPHHDFVTSLSAITYEGSYVCVVAKELNEPTPNFIVVYDLQSGTLFKKWKPACNTVALAISQSNACVIAGLENAKILIWDLVTGNCRATLVGHNAPVTFLKIDPIGKVLLSRDKEGRDNAIRLWELNTGSSVATFKPNGVVTTCEILPNGSFVVIAMKDKAELLVLALKNYTPVLHEDECYYYGNHDNQNKVFKIQQT